TAIDTPSAATERNQKRMTWLINHDRYDLPNRLRPTCHRGEHTYVSMYGRLRWNEPAQTITSGFGSMGQGRYVHPGLPRTITPHEAARLQMLPDFTAVSVARTRSLMARLIGNAVPPPLSTMITQSVLLRLQERRRSRPVLQLVKSNQRGPVP